MQISKEFRFEAAHSLPHLPAQHKCHRLHGHSYLIEIWAQGELDPKTGFTAGLDYSDLALFANAHVVDILDHQNINEFVSPSTAENLAVWIWEQLKPFIPALFRVDVRETSTTLVRYEG